MPWLKGPFQWATRRATPGWVTSPLCHRYLRASPHRSRGLHRWRRRPRVEPDFPEFASQQRSGGLRDSWGDLLLRRLIQVGRALSRCRSNGDDFSFAAGRRVPAGWSVKIRSTECCTDFERLFGVDWAPTNPGELKSFLSFLPRSPGRGSHKTSARVARPSPLRLQPPPAGEADQLSPPARGRPRSRSSGSRT